jgi:peptidoglycan/xylan/chitin deacetylase (PgdA/CDA1 family)/glycosyltransferase involved in cell wall biosynthesis
MRAQIGKILPGPEVHEPVFEDPSGLRIRHVKRWGRIGAVALVFWGLAIALAILNPGALPGGKPGAEPAGGGAVALAPVADGIAAGRSDAGLLIAASAGQGAGGYDANSVPAGRPRCEGGATPPGAAIAAPASAALSRVYALLPNDVENAFLPLLRNCGRIDVVLPEWHVIDGPDLGVKRDDVDAEMEQALDAVREARAGATEVWPVVSFGPEMSAQDLLAGTASLSGRAALVEGMLDAAREMQATAVCLAPRDLGPADAAALMPVLSQLAARARAEGLGLCLVTSLSDRLWRSASVVGVFDKVIVHAYQEPWIGSHPQPLAPVDWFRDQVGALKAQVPQDKLVVAVGGHAVDWISGQAVPERISLAEAMFRIASANADIRFSQAAGNSFAAFFDQAGRRHQIWLLDAASVHNSIRILQDLGVTEMAIPSLGQEEPAYWDAVAGQLGSGAAPSFGRPSFPDNVVFTGQGAFYRLAAPGQAGARLWRLDEESGLIEALRYEVVPRPVQMERYGRQDPTKIALTFDDGPNAVATRQILDALARHDAPATFFVVGQVALSAPDLLERALAEGHVVGSHSFSHPHMEDLSPFMMRIELNAARNLVEGVIGRSPLLFRPPYVRGPGPLDEAQAMAFAVPEEEGYVVVGSDIVPPDWAGASAEEIVAKVLKALETTGGNVIVLHDGRSTGMHTAEAVDLLVPALRARGYEIVPLPVLLGTTVEAVMPPVGLTSSAFKGVSVSTIALLIAILTAIFWVCVFASAVRSAIYLYLSARREPVYPRHFGGPPTVTVVVPAYNEDKVIVATVRSVLASNYPGLSCIVVDDGSTDDTLKVLQAAFATDPRVRVLTQPNRGKWQALNHAFQVVETEIAVCLDADTRMAPNAITEILRPFADSKVAAVAGTVVVGNATNLLTRFQAVEYITAQQIGRRAHEHLNGILVVPGALGAWRVEAVRDVGLYSNETLTEDADLTIWLRRGGYRVAYAERARSATEAPADVRSLMKQRLRWSFGNLQTLWKHRGAFGEFGPRRVFSLIDMVFFGYVLPVLSPVLDLLFLYFLAGLVMAWQAGTLSDGIEMSHLALAALALVQLMDLITAFVAHRREGAPVLRLLYLVPLMNLLYRPLLYITVYRALWSAISGRLARWNKLRRQGGGVVPGVPAE